MLREGWQGMCIVAQFAGALVAAGDRRRGREAHTQSVLHRSCPQSTPRRQQPRRQSLLRRRASIELVHGTAVAPMRIDESQPHTLRQRLQLRANERRQQSQSANERFFLRFQRRRLTTFSQHRDPSRVKLSHAVPS